MTSKLYKTLQVYLALSQEEITDLKETVTLESILLGEEVVPMLSDVEALFAVFGDTIDVHSFPTITPILQLADCIRTASSKALRLDCPLCVNYLGKSVVIPDSKIMADKNVRPRLAIVRTLLN